MKTASWLALSSSQQELLKWAAASTMTLDHANRTLWPYQAWAFAVGRLAFPLFVFLLAYNTTVRAVPVGRYLTPLLAFGILSQPPALAVLGRDILPLNILFTLLLGVTFLEGVRVLARSLPRALALSLGVLVWGALGLFVEYGPVGVFLVPATQLLLGRPDASRVGLVTALVLAANGFTPASFAPMLVPVLIGGAARTSVARLPRTRWVFYAFYPGHLALLWLLDRVGT